MIKPHAIRQIILFTLLSLFYGCRQGHDQPRNDQPNTPENISLRIAAASDLQPWFGESAEQWGRQQNPPMHIQAIYGNSNQLATQIRAGAPYHLFLSADVSIVDSLAKDQLAKADSVYVYALGQLALLTPEHVELKSLIELPAQTKLQRIVIANPQTAPYGQAAQAALKSARVWDTLKGRIVIVENARQALQQVISGNADAGLVALGHAHEAVASNPSLRITAIPESLHPPIRQGLGVIIQPDSTPGVNQAITKLIGWIKSEQTARLFNQHGLITNQDEPAKQPRD